MSKVTLPVALNMGLNTVAPPLTAQPGSLIECLNYEITDGSGYRRIDGYEAYDGFPNGAVYEYFRLQLNAVVGGNQTLIVPGSFISRVNTSGKDTVVGTVVGGMFGVNNYDVVPASSVNDFILTEEFMLMQDGTSLVSLQGGTGFFKILGTADALGSKFYVTTPTGTRFEVIVSDPVSGATLVTVADYITNLRAYATLLRNAITKTPTEVAGLYWMDDRLYGALNSSRVTVVVPVASTQPVEGVRLRWQGKLYRLGKLALLSTTGGNNTYAFHIYPIGTTGTVDDNLVEVNTAGTASTTWATALTTAANVNSADSTYAFLGYFNNPDIVATRGFTYLTAATNFSFDTGKYPTALGFPLTFDVSTNPADVYYIVGDAGATVFKVRVTQQTKATGDFVAGSAVGAAQVVVLGVVSGTRDYLKANDVLHNVYPTTGSSAVARVTGTPTIAAVAGTGALDLADTRYQWETANFYGQVSTTSAYGCTGASKAFWVNPTGFGTISTGTITDNPKYIAFHKSCLALGFSKGSVMLSVEGEPYNYQGLDGAVEIATGDAVTGLLELPGDTLAVFGRRAIRSITGAASTVNLGTIAARGGCIDYTAVLIGADAVFTGINGITTLQQTAAYGDFAGERLSDDIIDWLRPKLITGARGFEAGGVIMAYPVKSKNQYRLVLASGEIVCVTISRGNGKCMILSHNSEAQTRYPVAWSTEIDLDGRERIHVRWNGSANEKTVYELESGWGFNGVTFKHYFDMSHIFATQGAGSMTIENLRLFGKGYGLATLNVKSAGIEENFDQPYHDAVQDISLPYNVTGLNNKMQAVTSSIDQANWGIGVKLRIIGTIQEGSTLTEPPHICQSVLLHIRAQGAE